MRISNKGIELIKHFESLRLESYLCPASIATIGWGTTVLPDGTKVKLGMTCTEEQAEKWLLNDIYTAESCVNKSVTTPLKQNEFDALVSFVYNVGCGAFRVSSLRKFLNEKRELLNIEDSLCMWNKVRQNGVLVPSAGLTNRRRSEAYLFLHDELFYYE